MPTAAPTMPELADRRIETAALAVFRLQPLRGAKDAAEETDVLAEHDDIVVAAHHHVHGVADGFDHGLARHGSDSRLLALPSQMRRHFRVDILEHVAHRGLAAGMQRAVAFGLLLRGDHGVQNFGFRLLVALLRPGAALRSGDF